MNLYLHGNSWRGELYGTINGARKRIARERVAPAKMKKSVAQSLWTARCAEILKGNAGIAPKDLSIGEVITDYLEHIEGAINPRLGKNARRPATLQGYKENARNVLKEFAGEKRVSQIEAKHLRTWRKKRADHPYAYNRALNFLSAAINFAIKEKKYTGENPTKGVDRYEEEPRVRALTKEEFRDVRKEAVTYLQWIMDFAVGFGFRVKSQILKLKKSDVDLVKGTVIARKGNAKNKKDLVLTIRPELIPTFVELLKISKCEYLFTHPLDPTKPLKSIKTALKGAIKRSGVAPFRPHDLRHTFATWLIEAGVPLSVVKELGGWAKLEMLDIYVNHSEEHKEAALNSVPWFGAGSGEADTQSNVILLREAV